MLMPHESTVAHEQRFVLEPQSIPANKGLPQTEEKTDDEPNAPKVCNFKFRIDGCNLRQGKGGYP